ncbi:MAG TPA: hypothetical protein VK666_10865 [Chryseolinea sp.]|nr:hypothetical protein [Chryseolinea sp.]
MKTPISKDDEEFYVGYLPTMPPCTASVMRSMVIAIGVLVVLTALLIAFNQLAFSTAVFEYGEETTLKGQLILTPVPHIDYKIGDDAEGHSLSKTVLLVGAGKFGFDSFIQELTVKYGAIDRHNVSAKGYLIYGDGKLLLQVNRATDIDVSASPIVEKSINVLNIGEQSVTGEIIDPKCFFGVMKPAEGKTHRDCAIRCIAGGLPPIIKVANGKYLLLTGEHGDPINSQVLSLVGDQITLSGQQLTMNDWQILQVTQRDLDRLTLRKQAIDQLFSDKTITICASMDSLTRVNYAGLFPASVENPR